jgi:hypothetical protein
MAALVAAIHALEPLREKGVDPRNKSGDDVGGRLKGNASSRTPQAIRDRVPKEAPFSLNDPGFR